MARLSISLGELRIATYTGTKKASGRSLGEFRLQRQKGLFSTDGLDYWEHEEWSLQRKHKTRWQYCGFITVMAHGRNRSVAQSEIEEAFQGFGLGKLSYKALAKHYGHLESDACGTTSLEAKRVWKALKARRIGKNRFRVGRVGK